MASREKKPLAPSKAKQKASNDSGSPMNEIKNRKGKPLSNLKQQQLAQDILEAVATGSQLPPKLEATVPRKKVLKTLKRKQQLRVAKVNLIKSKVTRKVTNRNLCRIPSDVKKGGARSRRIKLSEENNSRSLENHVTDVKSESESTETEGGNKSAKNNLRTKKTKGVPKTSAEVENEDILDRDAGSVAGSSTKGSPKLGRKGGRALDSSDSLQRSLKAGKFSGFRRNNIKEKDPCIKTEIDIKYPKGRKCTRDVDYSNTRISKSSFLNSRSSIEITIDEVIASMLSDSETENQQEISEKIEGKVTRSKKMLVEENNTTTPDIEIKKEPDSEDARIVSDGENPETESSVQNAIQSRKRSNASTIGQRSLRNGKLRQSESDVSTESELKKGRRPNSDDPVNSEVSMDNITDTNIDTESSFSESSGNDTQIVVLPIKDEATCLKHENLTNFEDNSQAVEKLEVENNNNGDRVADRGSTEVGPTLRSKTKAKSIDETKTDNIKLECGRISGKNSDVQEEAKKASSVDQVRKDNILAKFSDKSKSRRSSLNIDMKKTVNSFYSTEKSDGGPKSQIDQMIENIKITIAKSIESKIFGPEKGGLGLSKNFDVPKMEEIVAPLSAESQKLGLDENNADEDESAVSKNEIKSDSTENSTRIVPKVADTAKEIEKLVMGDIELTETHSQNVQDNESSDADANENGRNVSEVKHSTENNGGDCKPVEQQEAEPSEVRREVAAGNSEKPPATQDDRQQIPDDAKKILPTRRSPRTTDKTCSDNGETKKSNAKSISKTAEKSENCEDSSDNAICDKVEETASNEDNETNKSAVSEISTASAAVTSDKVTEAAIETDAKTNKVNKEETKVSLIDVVESDEVETLESISKEVERLVAEENCTDQPKRNTNETQDDVSSIDTEKEQEATSVETKESEESVEVAKNAKEIEEFPETVTGAIQEKESKKNKNNCQSTTAAAASSNSKENSVPSDACCSTEDKKEDVIDTMDPKRRNNDIDKEEEDKLISNTTPNDLEHNESTVMEDETEKSVVEEQKSTGDDGKKRVLRARDKTKKLEKGPASHSKERNECSPKVKVEEDVGQKTQSEEDSQNSDKKLQDLNTTEDTDDTQNSAEFDSNDAERQARTRRGRDAKKRKEESLANPRNKRPKREIRKTDQQNKEETLLDNEVAKINENNRSFLNKYGNEAARRGTTFRGFSEGGRRKLEKREDTEDNARSKSENDLVIDKEPPGKGNCENRFSLNLSANPMTKQENIDVSDADCKPVKTPETSQKDSDETSTSGESSSSANATPKILETPEDKVKKESILRMLGLESLEKAAERLNHQRAKKVQYTGTLKTVIRLQKEKEKDKRRSRSPLKIVLKQGRGDGEGDAFENFYTVQKEPGVSGDSSSGANRKFSTNHRHSCDEDNEETPSKDHQSLVIPEKSSSFSIHPGRLCADVCCYCFGKFGSLDTPMHLAQMKSDERRKKILSIEKHLTNDSCLCDACYRHVDRKANTSPTNMQAKPPKQHRQLMVPKCTARNCRNDGRHHVKRRWLLKVKPALQKDVDIDFESSQHPSMSLCVNHYSKIERFLTCSLCKRRLARNHAHQLASAETDELNQLLGQQRIPVILTASTFVCKLCRYFTQLQLKYKDVENMNTNHRLFFKSYRKRILHYHDIEVSDSDDDSPQNPSTKDKDKEKDKRKKIKCSTLSKNSTSKSPDDAANSVSEKSTPEPNKNERTNPETENENRTPKANSNSNDENAATDVQFISIENTIDKLKKRKMLDMHLYTTPDVLSGPCESPSEVVEILARDKEVTLTRLPKRPRTSNDITPVVQRLGANPSISVRTLFPGEEEMNLHANVEFNNVREITPQGWEKCATMIQYDRETKVLWQELQRPYGNQSSFLRHLILLEKYYRSGDLILAPNASRNAINYSTSVQNRLISYEGPEKMDEPIMEPMASEYHNSRRMSGGFVFERDKHPSAGSTPKPSTVQSAKGSPPRALKLNPGVSIIKKPPPNLQRLNLPSTSAAATTTANGTVKRKDATQKMPPTAGGKVFQLSESDYKRLQHLKKQKQQQQQLHTEKQSSSGSSSGAGNSVPPQVNIKSATQFQKAQIAAHTQFQKHLRMQQEMLNRQSRSDFEPLICDVRVSANENSPTQNVIHNLNLPKSIQVTTKTTSNQIPILPKIPKSLTVIPQTITRPADK